jgi:hypothetical protein
MRYQIDIDPAHYNGAHVQTDPNGRGYWLCLHFADPNAASAAQQSLARADYDSMPADDDGPIGSDPSRAGIDPATAELVSPPPGMEWARGLKMRQRADRKWEPADWEEYDRRKAAAEAVQGPAAGPGPVLDQATADLVAKLTAPAGNTEAPPPDTRTPSAVLEELGRLWSQPGKLDEYLAQAGPTLTPEEAAAVAPAEVTYNGVDLASGTVAVTVTPIVNDAGEHVRTEVTIVAPPG